MWVGCGRGDGRRGGSVAVVVVVVGAMLSVVDMFASELLSVCCGRGNCNSTSCCIRSGSHLDRCRWRVVFWRWYYD